eukprot:Anaeramoba_ignava/a217172_926.p1 GENE.a217172_926~~a217172_926.p1  ORF type:complete len:246 (-),score=51.64 a217172_926:45-782(-)
MSEAWVDIDDGYEFKENEKKDLRTTYVMPSQVDVGITSKPLVFADAGGYGYLGLAAGLLILAVFRIKPASDKYLFAAVSTLFMPGSLMLIAGLFELARKRTFQGTFFLLYGVFWAGLAQMWYALDQDVEKEREEQIKHIANGAIGYIFVTIVFFLVSLQESKVLAFMLFFLLITLITFTIETYKDTGKVATAIFAIITSGFAFYASMATLFNVPFGIEIIRVGAPFLDWRVVYQNKVSKKFKRDK